MAETKEIHFFDNEQINIMGDVYKYRYYHSFFNNIDSSQYIGEATPSYVWWKGAISRIHRYNPKIKLIVVLRNPVKRAYSHWNMEVQRGAEKRTFSEAIRVPVCQKQQRIHSYVERGFYAVQLHNVFSYFPASQVLCLKQEDLKCESKRALSSVTEFIGVEKFNYIKNKNVHSRAYEKPMRQADASYLIDLYSDDIKKLEEMLGWDLSDWLEIKHSPVKLA